MTSAEELEEAETLVREQEACDAPTGKFCPVCRRPATEQWRSIPEFVGYYVSDRGRGGGSGRGFNRRTWRHI